MRQTTTTILLIASVFILLFVVVDRHQQKTIGAVFSKGAYTYAGHLKDPKEFAVDYNTLVKNIKTDSWGIDTALSQNDITVYVPLATPHMPANSRAVTIAFRGTDIQNASGNRQGDLFADFDVAVGNFDRNPRVLIGVLMFRRVRQKYPNFYVQIVGHSLGGSIAEAVTRIVGNDKFLLRTQTFDKGSGLQAARRSITDYAQCNNLNPFKPDWCDKVAHERVEWDAVSMTGSLDASTTTFKPDELKNKSIFEKFAKIRAHDVNLFNNIDTNMDLNQPISRRQQLQLVNG